MNLDDIKEYAIPYYEDERGQIFFTHRQEVDGKKFLYDTVAIRKKNVLVGFHGDFNTWKLITCLYGEIQCAFLDNRANSESYLKHKTIILSQENKKQILLPPGFGNAFLVLSEFCVYNYKLFPENGKITDRNEEFVLRYDKYGVDWLLKNPILSSRDKEAT